MKKTLVLFFTLMAIGLAFLGFDNGTLTLSGATLTELTTTFDDIGTSALSMLISVITSAKSLIILGIGISFIMMFVRRR